MVWQKQSGSGSTTSTMVLPSFVGGGSFQASGGLEVQLPEGDFKTQIQSLSSQSGLTPAGAALVAVAVAWATAGQGANLLGTSGTTTTTVGGVVTTSYTTAGLVANAAFTSLASQASITLINTKGDIGKTLTDMASSTVKAALGAALTAGVLDKIGRMAGKTRTLLDQQTRVEKIEIARKALDQYVTSRSLDSGRIFWR